MWTKQLSALAGYVAAHLAATASEVVIGAIVSGVNVRPFPHPGMPGARTVHGRDPCQGRGRPAARGARPREVIRIQA
ncbi:hypothetical protein [Nonomuraea sp. LPB2021202275-12-8]|uniref:hypothetical protein n=1 Tax=Nonomuraea sp. LPB2021202275-12-8 TaxID=3120159 RepID=UPI00300C4020